jgi:hypothetical protein
MPIGFRCTGCRARLHVPKRWAGNTLPCPKCGTRVVVPAAAHEHEPTAFEDAAVERSLASLQVPRVAAAGGIFADDAFELPSAGEADGAQRSQDSLNTITLSRWAIYAYVILVPVIAAAAFGLGCWWTAAGDR